MEKRMMDSAANVLHGDCRDVLRDMLAAGRLFDSCVTDPPYHLTSVVERFGGATAAPAKHGTDGLYARQSAGFMGKQWDGGDIAFRPDLWRQVYEVLKPGAYLLAFGGTRTAHRMAVAIEDAGFEIRDTIMWVYGSGFPKSHKVSKGIDKAAGGERAYQTVAEAARKWQGWGTALKPAWEPIIVARKPLIGTVAENVLAHGTGALNIDACRVDSGGRHPNPHRNGEATASNRYARRGSTNLTMTSGPRGGDPRGRWPANLIMDGSDEVRDAFPAAPGQQGCVSGFEPSEPHANVYGKRGRVASDAPRNDTGSAARFFKACLFNEDEINRIFYHAKANKKDRAGSSHPTVKPIALMRYLCRLVTQPGGHVLDPFAGSGATLAAALAEGCSATGIEREAEYIEDIQRRLGRAGGLEAAITSLSDAIKVLRLGLGHAR